MLIDFNEINNILKENNINITGAFHLGAHECEELDFYKRLGLNDNDIIWIEAISSKVIDAKNKGIVNIYDELITDEDNIMTGFNITNNYQSSSLLELGTHKYEHPQVFYTEKIYKNSIKIDSFFKKYNLQYNKYNFWNFDIQGAELKALKGSIESIKNVDVLYLEVNEKELYKDCALINELDEFLLKFDFKRVLTKMTTYGWGDALYIKNNQKFYI